MPICFNVLAYHTNPGMDKGAIMSNREFQFVYEMMEQRVPFNRWLGVKIEMLAEGSARLAIPYRPELIGDSRRPALHGGVISMLVDTCGGAAIFTALPAGAKISTVDMRVDYLRPARPVTLIAEARVVRIGNRVGVANVVVYQERVDEPVAEGKTVYNIRLDSDER
jgi:uncharacterized protein (TIGR00369 family)